MDSARRDLARPTLAMLPRAEDNLSFLFADIVRIVQSDTGVSAQTETDDGRVYQVQLPAASVACLLLGPGTSITQPAMQTFFRHGATIVACGSGGVLYYGSWQHGEKTTKWLQKQVHAYADEGQRETVARAMYKRRFGEQPAEGTSIAELRRFEARRMQALYRTHAQRHKIKPFRRSYDPGDWDSQDPVNKAFGAANSALYGVVNSVLAHLGLSPALGFVHHGKQNSFVSDIADLYKAEITVPLAFSLHASEEPEGDARRQLRKQFRLYRMIPRIIRDTQLLLSLDDEEAVEALGGDEDVPSRWAVADLWDPVEVSVPGGRDYSSGGPTAPKADWA